MCGRYALALRPSQVRAFLEDEHMPVFDAPEDDADDAPRQSYNFAPGYHGLVYRADVPDHGAGAQQHKIGEGNGAEEVGAEEEAGEVTATNEEENTTVSEEVRYKLQSMKWGLIPFWTKRNPDYGTMMKTMNCRDDSLIENRGMWTSMKNKKRCIVVCQGFYEWLKKGPKEKVPHYTKRKDGKLMCFAGLWDCVQYEGSEEKLYTYTVITTSSNKQLNFLHDRMPVILENGSDDIRTWLDPKRNTWSKELQSLLKPSDTELEIYPVSKDVGKVGNNSPSFIIPVASSENKSNIANFFAKGAAKGDSSTKPEEKNVKAKKDEKDEVKEEDKEAEDKEEKVKEEEVKEEIKDEPKPDMKNEPLEDRKTIDHEGTEDNAPLPVPKTEVKKGIKRELDDVPDEDVPRKHQKTASSSKTEAPSKPVRTGRSATSNKNESPSKSSDKAKGIQSTKITKFFGK